MARTERTGKTKNKRTDIKAKSPGAWVLFHRHRY